MLKTESVAWVVYMTPMAGRTSAMSAVCEQSEWDAMALARPGFHTLVRAGIANEAEAEKLARESSGFVPSAPKTYKSPPATKVDGPKRSPASSPRLK